MTLQTGNVVFTAASNYSKTIAVSVLVKAAKTSSTYFFANTYNNNFGQTVAIDTSANKKTAKTKYDNIDVKNDSRPKLTFVWN